MPISRRSMQVSRIVATVREKCLSKVSLELLAKVQRETSKDLESEQPFVRYIFNRTY